MSKKLNRVTYEELENSFSNFEVAYLSFFKASDILRSSKTLIQEDSALKPKLSVVAYDEVASDLEKAKAYKEELKERIFKKEEEEEEDLYIVEDESSQDDID